MPYFAEQNDYGYEQSEEEPGEYVPEEYVPLTTTELVATIALGVCVATAFVLIFVFIGAQIW